MADPKKLTIDAGLQVEGSEDTTQLEVRGSATQTEPLQEWQDASGEAVARLGADGRMQVGDLDLDTPDALVEANEAVTLPTDRPLRGIQSLGQISGVISDAIAWAAYELQLLGSGGVSGLHAALRAVLTLNNSGGAVDAEVRAGDFEVINASDPVGKVVGVSSAITNESGGTITEAVAFSVEEPVNQGETGSIGTLVGLDVPDLDQADENFAIRTGKGQVRLGDFMEMEQLDTAPGGSSGVVRVYPKTDGKLYARAPNGTEYDLTASTGGGGGGGMPADPLPLENGGTESDLHETGPGIVQQASAGAPLTVSPDVAVGNLVVDGAFATGGPLNVTLSGNVNDWNPAGLDDATDVRVTLSDTHWIITGIAGGYDGRVLYISCVDFSNILTLKSTSGLSLAGNQIQCPGNVDIDIAGGGQVCLVYDGTDGVWRVNGWVINISTQTRGLLPIGKGGTNRNSYAKGDILWANATDSLDQLAAGSLGQVLKVVGAQTLGYATLLAADISDFAAQLATALSSYIANTIFAAKGDILIGTADNTPDILGVGIDGDSLTPDSSLPKGLKWITRPITPQARLTLTSGTPITSSNVTGAGTLYWTPIDNGQITLYDTSANLWKRLTLTEISLSLAGLIVGVIYDIFVYNNSGTPTLEALAWKKVTASNSPTAGSSKTINLSDTSTLAVGMKVTVRDGSHSEITQITAVVASTSITVNTLANSYTTPDVYGYLARATALSTQNGMKIKSGDASRLWVGKIRITSTTGQTEDSDARRFVVNTYNKENRRLFVSDFAQHTFTGGSFRSWNADDTKRIEFLAELEDLIELSISANTKSSMAGVGARTGIAIDNTTTLDSETTSLNNENTQYVEMTLPIRKKGVTLGIGYHYVQAIEMQQGGSGSGSFNQLMLQGSVRG